MKQNQSRLIKLLLLLIAVFAILFLKSELPGFLPKKTNQPFSSIQKDQIKEISLTKDNTTLIYKKDKNWYLKKENIEFKADQEKINKIIDSFINLKKDNVISTNKNKHKELGIAKQKIHVKENENTHIVYLGNTSGLSNNYVRINEENEVFITEGFEEAFLSDDYRDLSVPIVKDEAKVTSIEIQSTNQVTSLVKKEGDWKIADKPSKKDRVDFYLNDLKTLKAVDIKQKKQNYSNVSSELSIIIKENGEERTIKFYSQTEENYLARLNFSDYDYVIAAAYVASLKKEEKDFLE